ncbi:hypothetical protein PR048_026379 [Dryococelus australis]|uniref:HAT C-terminal dimerisation domain-containing protein n=1 Tax=Dryococelus australis TaxID=614101 RepID=A0ABQ9GL56_9NEOP|nr:hypothetical protein PR048_026379 [Dryococelus australis]
MTSIWIKILQCFDQINLIFQSRTLPIDIAAENINEILKEMQMLRDNWTNILSECKLAAAAMDISTELKEEQHKLRPGDHKGNAHTISPEDSFKRDVFTSSLVDEIVHLKAVLSVHLGILRIVLSLSVTVAEGERSFSELNLVKHFLRSTILEDRLNDLAVLSIEHELANNNNCDDIIRDFVDIKGPGISVDGPGQQYQLKSACAPKHAPTSPPPLY